MNHGMSRRGPPPELPGEDAGVGPEHAGGLIPLDWGLLVLGAARRRKWIAAVVFLLGIEASVAYYRSKRPLYRVETRILAQRQQALPSVVRPSTPPDDPTRSAWELVHRRENLIALVKEADLFAESDATSAASSSGGLLERLRRALRLSGPSPADDDPLSALVLRLDRALQVTTADETITISMDWPDPHQAHRVVAAALQNFLEARQLQEITAIDEAISLLQGRVATLRDQLQRAIEDTRRGTTHADSPPRQAARRSAGEELARIKSMVEAKDRAIADVEEFRRRRLADLQAQLDAKRGIYSDAHPDVISLRQDIAALSRESPQIAALRAEERKLREEYAVRLAHEGRPPSSGAAPSAAPRAAPGEDQDERVREARLQYQQMLERVSAAQLDLDAARAAFKYRYSVIWPAQVPNEPVSPKPVKIFGLGALASLLLGLFAAAAPDLLSGRIVERRQVERSLDLPVLGELRRK
jgi:uncharacterized protein involved in exopolysaccharide biosynthesis